jgi:hypothetical protein
LRRCGQLVLGLRAQPREDNGLSSAESVFGCPLVLPNEFLQNDEIAVENICKKFASTVDAPVLSLPRHNSSQKLPDELPEDLVRAHLVWSGSAATQPASRSSAPMTAPSPASPADREPSPTESGRETRSCQWLVLSPALTLQPTGFAAMPWPAA